MRWSLIPTLLLLLWSLALSSGCSRARSATSTEELEVRELRFLTNPGQVSLLEVAADLGHLAPLKLSSVGSTFSGPADIQTVATGDSDIGLAFHGAIIKLIAAGAPVQAVVGGYGVDEQTFNGFYVLEDSPIRQARDLIGKKVAMNTLGAHFEFVLREYLSRHGLSPDEVREVEMVVMPPVNTEHALRAKQVDVAVLGNMLRDKALERGGIRPLFTDVELYGPFTAGSYVLHERFIREHPKAARKLVEAIAKTIEWERSTPREQVIARQLAIAERRGNRHDAASVRYWRTAGIAGPGGLIAPRELTMWIESLERVGALSAGDVKLSRLYTDAFNPYRKR